MKIPPSYPFTTLSAEPIDVTMANEPWSEYRLRDGTTIRARLRLRQFRRWGGHYDVDGKPVYSNESHIEFEVDPPPELMQR